MSAMSEQHLEQCQPGPADTAPYTVASWDTEVRHCSMAAWRRTGLPVDFGTVYRLVDEALREFAPDCVPEGQR